MHLFTLCKETRKDRVSNAIDTYYKRSSKKGRVVDALALSADERRDKLR